MERTLVMFRRTVIVSAVAAALSSLASGASAKLTAGAAERPAAHPGMQLAQSGDIDIYYDRNGNRIIVDAYSGEVLAIERPRRAERRVLRRELRPQQPEQDRLIGRLDEYGALRETFPEAPPEAFPPLPEGFEEPDWSAEPNLEESQLPEEPEIATRSPIERAPLEPPSSEPDTPTIVEGAIEPPASFGARDDVAALQVLVDRRGASPGVIDGHFGSNVDKAIVNYREITGENLKSTDAEGIKAALAASGGDPFIDYTITAQDAAGPFVAAVPADYGEKAKLERLSYTSVAEALAERFHMDEKYLKALNPEANFARVGTIIRVANVGSPATRQVARIVADKSRKEVLAYDAGGELVVAYPATIGSADTPSPSGVHKVTRVAFDPDYTYNPNLNFKQGENNSILKIPPGPNGPVGSIWIALDKPTYGIHGTPEPSKIGKTESHGCVRLTNWDAQELAKLVKPEVMVEFVD
jgi:lipoprotein-anchoring transpeptidase ErfK/SrfK